MDGLQYGRQNADWTVINTSDNYVNIVYVNNINPTFATIFDTNNPPIINNNSLKADDANLYIGIDASTWVYKTSTTTYETKPITSSTSNFYLSGTTTDAGNSKTANIKRTGRVGGGNAIDSDDFVTKSQHDTKANNLTDINFGAFQSVLPTVTTVADTDKVPFLIGSLSRMMTVANLKVFLKTYFDSQYSSESFNQSRWSFTDFVGTGTIQGPFTGAALAGGTVDTTSYTTVDNATDNSSLGAVDIRCSASANSGYRFIDAGSAFLSKSGITFLGRLGLNSVSVGRDRIIRLGFISTSNQVAPAYGIYLEVLGNSATFKATSSSVSTSSSSVTLNESFTGSTIWYYYVFITYTADRTVKCVLYDKTMTSVLSITFVTSDNIPVSGNRMNVGVIATITTAGTAVSICQVDYLGIGLAKPSFLNNF